VKVRNLIELLSQHDPDMDVDAWQGQPLDIRDLVRAADAKAALLKDTLFASEQQRQRYTEHVDALIDPTEQQLYLLLSAYA